MSNFKTRSEPMDGGDRDAWKDGFQIGSTGGMVCDICRCLVRQDPGSAKAHRDWHDRIGG